MGKKSGPPPPDYTAAAEKTAQSNKEAVTAQTWANRADQYSPYGSQTWDTQTYTDPATGQAVTKWVQNTTLDPRLQQALDSQIATQTARSQQAEGLIGRMNQEFGQQMDWSGLGAWGQGPQAGQLGAYTNAYGFGPRQQRIDTGRQGQEQLQRGLDFGGVQGVQGAQQNRQSAEDAIYQAQASRLDPQFAQQQRDMETQLANQGITRNSAAYSRAMEDFNRNKQDAYRQAQLAAVTGGGAEAQRNQAMDMALRQQQVGEIGQQGQFGNQAALSQFGMGQQARQAQLAAQQAAWQQSLGGQQYGLQQQQQAFGQQQAAGAQNFNQQLAQAQFQNQMRQQQLAEAMQQRGFSLNEINALLSGQQVQTPSFAGYNQAGNAGGTNYYGAVSDQFGAGMQQQQMKNQATGDIIGGVAGIAAMFSDRATKTILARFGTHSLGFGIWWFKYFGETLPRLGVIAQEVQRVAPELVHRHRSGLLMVDYSKL